MNQKTNKENYTIPHIVFTTKDPSQQNWNDFVAIQKKFLTLPEEIQDVLTSPKTGDLIYRIGQKFGLPLLQIASIARMVRAFYFGNLQKNNLAHYLQQDADISLSTAQSIASLVAKNILDADPKAFSLKQTPPAQKVSLPLTEALTQFPKLSTQKVTDTPLVLSEGQEPVSGTVENWIADYRNALGAGKHGTMERGNYLFNAKNAKRLGTGERQRLARVLKSFDTDEKLSISEEHQSIVFEAPEEKKQKNPVQPKTAPAQKHAPQQRPPAPHGAAAAPAQSRPAPAKTRQIPLPKKPVGSSHSKPLQSRTPLPEKPSHKAPAPHQTQSAPPSHGSRASFTLPENPPQKNFSPDRNTATQPSAPVKKTPTPAKENIQFSSKHTFPVEQKIQKRLQKKKAPLRRQRDAFHMKPID